ncbi:MAG: threonine/serine dehydratase [Planctomycetes bacterium]|nr:threonine/serine dehydratase [Planctomycetota bacterium]MCB9886598.1 threonine/serine dehydratase [Planctomycetota bacterium]
MSEPTAPSVETIQRARHAFGGAILQTPAWQWHGHRIARLAPRDSTLWLKLELLQHTGSFKPRGAILVMRDLDAAQLARGVTAVSAGNHGMAVAYAASRLGTTAKVVMPRTANPARVAACRDLGADVVLTDDIASAFATAEELQREHGLHFVHPFEGERTVLGSATLGLEFLQQVGNLDAVFVAVGGGGLTAGVACAVKQLQPRCRVYAVEPAGADSMHRSFAAGSPQRIEAVRTIADSLGAPMAMPYTFALCRRFVDELVMVDDDAICRAMALLFADAKLAVEPAGAAALAALLQVGDQLAGKRIGIVVCGANVDPDTFATCLARGRDGII